MNESFLIAAHVAESRIMSMCARSVAGAILSFVSGSVHDKSDKQINNIMYFMSFVLNEIIMGMIQ